jgi:hypothetical protein
LPWPFSLRPNSKTFPLNTRFLVSQKKKKVLTSAVKYDDASWHSGGDFPADLPPEAGATHIAMFVAWALLHGLAGDIHIREFPEPLARLRERKITPGHFFLEACDGKFTDEDLSELGNRFAEHYYEHENTARHFQTRT